MEKPSILAYTELQVAYDYFNKVLFNNELPNVILTLQRQGRVLGYFSAERFDGKSKISELAMNPDYFKSYSLADVLSTLVHEMAHVWQHYIATKKSRRGYHDRVWGQKMESIGLIPSETGLPGGKKTGQRMSHYIAKNGKFQAAVYDLLKTDYSISWYDRFGANVQISTLNTDILKDWIKKTDPEETELIKKLTQTIAKEKPLTLNDDTGVYLKPTPKNTNQTRLKFTCEDCGLNAWAKPSAKLICFDCQTLLSSTIT